MSITIALPHQLRPLAGERDHLKLWPNGTVTLRSVIDSLDCQCPGIKYRLIGVDGKLRAPVKLYINNEDCRKTAKELRDKAQKPDEPPLPEADPLDLSLDGDEEIAILPAMAGA